MKAYYIKYKNYKGGDVSGIGVLANNKEDAYDKAVYESIPEKEGTVPYSAWVDSVTYQNGKHKLFHTFEGNPY